MNGYNLPALELEIESEGIWGKFLQSSIRTWNRTPSPLYQIPNAALGLLGEICEYLKERSADELGDVLYYRSILLWLLGDETKVSDKAEINFDIVEFTLLLSDFTKKAVYHDKLYDNKNIGRYQRMMVMLDAFLIREVELLNTSFEDVMQQNIDKLRQRHPKGFNPSYNNNN